MPEVTKRSPEVAGPDREVSLNVKMREHLRHELRLRAFQERMPFKDYLDKVLSQHIEQHPATM